MLKRISQREGHEFMDLADQDRVVMLGRPSFVFNSVMTGSKIIRCPTWTLYYI